MYLPYLLANSLSFLGEHSLLLNHIKPSSNRSTPIEKPCGVHLNSVYKTPYLHLPKQEKIKRCKTKIGNIKCHYNLVSLFFFFNRSHTDFVYNDILVSCHDYIPSDFSTPLNNKDIYIYIYIYKKEKKKRIIAYI